MNLTLKNASQGQSLCGKPDGHSLTLTEGLVAPALAVMSRRCNGAVLGDVPSLQFVSPATTRPTATINPAQSRGRYLYSVSIDAVSVEPMVVSYMLGMGLPLGTISHVLMADTITLFLRRVHSTPTSSTSTLSTLLIG